jgi:hypothetical protein
MTIVHFYEQDPNPQVLCAACLPKLGFVPFHVMPADPSNLCSSCGQADEPGPRRPDCDVLTYTTALRLIIQLSREHQYHAYHVLLHFNLADPRQARHAKLVIADALTDHTCGFNLLELADLMALAA